ncbi:MAG: 5-oxoprolinase/urea amidolyase family protein [Verrucomicrobiales bacterium]
MFESILIANRGEIACRLIRTARALGVRTVAVYSDADRGARHVELADEAVRLGPAAARESYLCAERLLEVARATRAQAVHPGYGFLSENADFADACEAAGLVFIGPTGDQMRRFGLKHTARALAEAAHVPLLPGTGLLENVAAAVAAAGRIGYPVMLKSTAGGGGIGMQACRTREELISAFDSVEALGRNNFSDGGLFIERFVDRARHIEVQLFGDGGGRVLALGERDCSAQRRNQKVIEETPAPNLPPVVRDGLRVAAVRLAESVGYRSAGTVEFVLDPRSGEFYFLEVNTRLQVEHGVTEAVYGIDLVEWMIRLAADGVFPEEVPEPQGHAIQVRLYAEDPQKNFQPSAGLLTEVRFPEGVRCDHWVNAGTEVSPFYDPLLAKLIVHGGTREDAIATLETALADTRLEGLETNRDYLRQVVAAPEFRDGTVWTRFLNGFSYRPRTIEVMDGGTQTTIQDYPGRLGYWAVGVPPSGPMDARSFQLANALVGNPPDAAGLECTLIGPVLRFHTEAVISLVGAAMRATVDGVPVANEQPISVSAGQELRLGAIDGPGARTYLAVRGGLDVPLYLGSRSTFTLGRFGGHGGRALRVGDVLKLRQPSAHAPPGQGSAAWEMPESPVSPSLTSDWEIRVMYGPHGAPDFFTDDDIAMIFEAEWKVHHNSARTGVRLVGPKPAWARQDGGEAGLHPSNIHDNAYAIGAIDFTGDMPIILGPDGPSLGGFVCPAVIVASERWKMGQLRPGDGVRFRPVSLANPVVLNLPSEGDKPRLVVRVQGDENLLVEYGPIELDLQLRFRVHALMTWFERHAPPGVIDLTPGIRSLQIHWNPDRLARSTLLELIQSADAAIPPLSEIEVPARIVHLPLAWDDSQTRLAIHKYQTGTRPDAPWCPSNLEFIRRINGLESIDDVKRIFFNASYLVLGLGDVYLGAPVAVPLDPRHRLVTTKYNPARTWTPENAVGIGGAYLCIYGMEGPGGYQFVGRTLQMWNRWRATAEFPAGTPWLLRFFDQVRFYEVSEQTLLEWREDFPLGRFSPRIEETSFRLGQYLDWLADPDVAAEARTAKERQVAAFDAERDQWRRAGLDRVVEEEPSGSGEGGGVDRPPDVVVVEAPLIANVWQVLVVAGQSVQVGERIAILEAMKMEIAIHAPRGGTIRDVFAAPGRLVVPGQNLFWIDPGATPTS